MVIANTVLSRKNEDVHTIYTRNTNPNAKWDWWVIGGRWNGLLLQDGSDMINCVRATLTLKPCQRQ